MLCWLNIKVFTDKGFSFFEIEKSAWESALHAQKGAYFGLIVEQKNLGTILTPISSLIPLISCSVEYLHFGGRKAEGSYAGGRREESVKRDKVFL